MHHRTTLNLPTPACREEARRAIAAQVDAFLQKGGAIIPCSNDLDPLAKRASDSLPQAMTIGRGKRQSWTPERLKILTENYATMKPRELAALLGLSTNSLYVKASQLGLKRKTGAVQ